MSRLAHQPLLRPGSGIRRIDFANFTYPGRPVYADLKSFTLTNGEFNGGDNNDPLGLAYLDYGDATGDGSEEALLILNMSVRGSAIPYFVYIYTLENEKPKLIWAFAAGDRADGGLRRVHAAGGELVVELYGKGKTIDKDLYADDGMEGGDCCPSHFTRATYEWRQDRFYQKGVEEVLSNPVGGAQVVMPKLSD